MDDDFGLGASVWSTEPVQLSLSPPPSSSVLHPPLVAPIDALDGFAAPPPLLPPPSSPLPPPSASSKSQFDDFDDFGDPADSAEGGAPADDDFGDFGDFGEAEEHTSEQGFEAPVFDEPAPLVAQSTFVDWEPLRLHPLPSRPRLQVQVEELLGPIFSREISLYTSDEDIREAEGLSQVLVTPERYGTFSRLALISRIDSSLRYVLSRILYQKLLQPPPQMLPPDWTRSRIRRQHLISLGVPINLDEVLPRSSAKALPALQITTRPMSAPPAPRSVSVATASASASRGGTPRSGTPQPGWRSSTAQLALGPKPELNEMKTAELLALEPGTIILRPEDLS